MIKKLLCLLVMGWIYGSSYSQAVIAVNDTVSAAEDSTSIFDVRANDYGGPPICGTLGGLQLDTGTYALHGTTVNLVNNKIQYTPAANFNGLDTIFYRICDCIIGSGNCANGMVFVTVAPRNDAPDAKTDVDTLYEDIPKMLAVAKNDIEIDGDVFYIMPGGGITPRHGIAIINPTFDSIYYLPAANYFGNDSFSYRICDIGVSPQLCDTAWVFLYVIPVNDRPVATDDSRSTNEDTPLTIDVQQNDSDIENHTLTTTVIRSPQHGTVTVLNGDSVRYSPAANYFGTDTFIYRICDSGTPSLCDTAIVIIIVNSVNDKPIARDDTATLAEDQPTGINITKNDTDADADILTAVIFAEPANGTVAIINNDSIVYTPASNFFGSDTIFYQLCDNGVPVRCDTAMLVFSVTPVNDKPIANDDLVNTNEDIPLTINVKGNDSDPDNTILNVTIINAPQHGTAAVVNDSIRYTPAANYTGYDTIVYSICDNGTPPLCDTAIVVVQVNAANDNPVANNDNVVISEESSVVVKPLLNDSDPEGDALAYIIIKNGSNGQAVQIGDSITYQPNLNFFGTDTVVVQVCDNGTPVKCDTSFVIINVTPVNDRPIAVDDNVAASEDVVLNIDVQNNDSDVDNTVLHTTIIRYPTSGTATVINGDSISYRGNTGFFGNDTIVYVVCDNAVPPLCDTAVVYIVIGQVNDRPVANNDAVTIIENALAVSVNVQLNDFDADNDSLTTYIVRQPANGAAVVVNGDSISYIPNNSFSGNDTIVYMVCDNGIPPLCDTAIVVVTVNNINNKPLAVDDVFNFVNEDQTMVIDVQNNDSDVDNTVFVTSIVSSPAHGTATVVNGDSIRYTPSADYYGNDTFYYSICDNGLPPLCDTAMVVVVVAPVGDNPVLNNDTATVNSGFSVIVSVLANDSDADGETLSTPVVLQPQHGSAVVNPDGTITYTPDPNYEGNDTVVYFSCDPVGNCDTAYIYIYVNKNEKPIAINDNAIFFETQTMAIDILQNDSDPDGDSLSVTIISNPAHGSVSVNGGVATYTPANGYVGQDSYVYVICDNGSPVMCDTATVTITVLDGDIKPITDNSISPNGDGVNDNFTISNLNLFTNTKLQIVNRWGDVVFEKENYQNDFNGSEQKGWKNLGDNQLPEGTYFYIFNYTYNSKQQKSSGYLILKR